MAQDRGAVDARRRRRDSRALPPLVGRSAAGRARHGLSVGIVESTQARNKLSRNTTFILTITALAALVFFTGYLLQLNIGCK